MRAYDQCSSVILSRKVKEFSAENQKPKEITDEESDLRIEKGERNEDFVTCSNPRFIPSSFEHRHAIPKLDVEFLVWKSLNLLRKVCSHG
jgi:hypothetical protein